MQNTHKTRVVVGMSGGVDSSVTALLLKQQGYDVQGLFMKNWEEDDTATYCSASTDIADADAVCQRLDIPFHTVNFAAEYWDNVFEHFLEEYRQHRTPNPDILCNKEIKFKAFLNFSIHLGADYIATGHYARRTDGDNVQLLKGCDLTKDQSYFLYALDQQQLCRALFPLGQLTKTEVRCIAANAGLSNSNKKDSTGICFIGERKFKNFLSRYLPAQPGNIETTEGKIIGKHEGLMYYTVGQRQGLGIGGQKHANEQPWYVLAKDPQRNTLIIGQGHDNPGLLSHSLVCSQSHWIRGETPQTPFTCAAKTRYRQQEQACTVTALAEDKFQVNFSQAQWAITPGQSVVFYQGDICLGGGIINFSD